MSSRTIQCLRCSKLARVDRSAPAKQWSLSYCNACYEEHVASGASSRSTKSSSGKPRAAKRTPRPRETVERGGGLYSVADDRPIRELGTTDLDKIQELLRRPPGDEGAGS